MKSLKSVSMPLQFAQLIRISAKKDSKMSKELHNTDGPQGVFQMFNHKSMFYFDSEVSSLPTPPHSEVATSGHLSIADTSVFPLRKRQSMPSLSIDGSGHVSSLAKEPHEHVPNGALPSSIPTADDLHIPSAIMSPAHFERKAIQHDSGSESHRYQTGAQYGSNQILKSFCHEFQLFGHQRKKSELSNVPEVERPVSCPPIPHCESSPNMTKQMLASNVDKMYRSSSSSNLRRLSLVNEAAEAAGVRTLVVAGPSDLELTKESKNVEKRGLLTTEKPLIKVETMVDGKSLPITRKVIEWFTTPQPQTGHRFKRSEMNTISPTSF